MDQDLHPAEIHEKPDEPPRILIVFTTPPRNGRSWKPVIDLLKASTAVNNCEWLIHITHLRRSITEAAVDLRARIDQQFILSGGYQSVVMIGVSIGGIVVRQAYLQSLGLYSDCPPTMHWAKLVARIVLIAAPNRGIGLDSIPAMVRGFFRSTLYFTPGGRFFVDLLTGSDFLTDLKIRWIYYFRTASANLPLVVHLLPARSGFISRASMIDEVHFPGAHYIDAPGINGDEMAQPRRYVEDRALFGLLHSAIFANLLPKVVPKARDIDRVVFVLHGIRTSNTGWVSQISNMIKQSDPRAEVVVATYGYYSLLRFPFVLSRRRNVRWFQDLYSCNFARYPDASFYFIGHSYGTYILGRSMARVPAMRFHRIVLVGSVLPREYRWSDRIDSGQADEIRNDRSSSDIPVKVLCSALHAFGRDVGTGGVDGFDEGRCREVCFYKGNHGRPLDRDNLPALADYLMDGTYVPPGGLVDDISPRLGVVARLAPAIGIVIICTLLLIIPGIWWVYKASGLPAAIGATLLVVLIAVILDAI